MPQFYVDVANYSISQEICTRFLLCCGYTLTDFPISIRLTSLALWQSNDCPSASKATLMNMDKYFMWIHYERLHNHNKAKHNKTVCIFLGIYCMLVLSSMFVWQISFSIGGNGAFIFPGYQSRLTNIPICLTEFTIHVKNSIRMGIQDLSLHGYLTQPASLW